MNKIVGKEYFSDQVVKLVIEAPYIARSRKAGHFVIVRLGEKGERIPLRATRRCPPLFLKSRRKSSVPFSLDLPF